ncbi:MAG: protein adenylyltransferase SelO family protein [Ilumatobacteraceae bacterium]
MPPVPTSPALELFRSVVDTASRPQWMLVGFVHGVMNTDNTTISGETIDYGPCAFMDRVDPGTVFSSIDHGGRYAYGNQPRVLQWNLARLAEALLPPHDDGGAASGRARDRGVDVVRRPVPAGVGRRHDGETRDLRRGRRRHSDVEAFVDAVPSMLAAQRVDHTGFFRALSAVARGDDEPARSLFADPTVFDAWRPTWQALVAGRDTGAIAMALDRANPVYIPRNHLVEDALDAATEGDLAPVHRSARRRDRPVRRTRRVRGVRSAPGPEVPRSAPSAAPETGRRYGRTLSHVVSRTVRRFFG